MNVYKNVLSLFILSILCLAFCSVANAKEEVITEIILINGLAELVDLSSDGQVLQRHLSIPDYFSSGRSHKRTLRESLAKTKLFGTVSDIEPYIETIVFKAPQECRQSLMKRSEKKDSNIGITSQGETNQDKLIFKEDIEKDLRNNIRSISYIRNEPENRIIARRQRTLTDVRFVGGKLQFSLANRTSKAIIDV